MKIPSQKNITTIGLVHYNIYTEGVGFFFRATQVKKKVKRFSGLDIPNGFGVEIYYVYPKVTTSVISLALSLCSFGTYTSKKIVRASSVDFSI